MTICASGTHHCNCQPDEGVFCYSLPVATVQREYEAKLHYVRQQLQQAEARVAELEEGLHGIANCAYGYSHPKAPTADEAASWMNCEAMRLLGDPQSSAWLLRKQAEAVEECYEDMFSLPEHLEFTAKEMAGFKCGLQHVKGEALSLRQQADELEND